MMAWSGFSNRPPYLPSHKLLYALNVAFVTMPTIVASSKLQQPTPSAGDSSMPTNLASYLWVEHSTSSGTLHFAHALHRHSTHKISRVQTLFFHEDFRDHYMCLF